MAYDPVQRNLKDGTLVISDDDSNSVTVINDNGGLSYTENATAIRRTDRGAAAGFREPPAQFVEVEFSMEYSTMISDTGASETPTPYEALKQKGNAAAWVSTRLASDDSYCVDLAFTVANPVSGGKNELHTFTDFHADEVEFAEGEEANTLRVRGTAMSVAVTRPAA